MSFIIYGNDIKPISGKDGIVTYNLNDGETSVRQIVSANFSIAGLPSAAKGKAELSGKELLKQYEQYDSNGNFLGYFAKIALGFLFTEVVKPIIVPKIHEAFDWLIAKIEDALTENGEVIRDENGVAAKILNLSFMPTSLHDFAAQELGMNLYGSSS
jgi:hypothetical protein